MKAMFSAGLAAAALVMSTAAPAAQPESAAVPATAMVAAPQANPMPIPANGTVPMGDPRFAPYCLRDTGSVIVAMQNRRAERHARATGTTPKLRCTATGVALKVNPDGVPVPDQGPATRVR